MSHIHPFRPFQHYVSFYPYHVPAYYSNYYPRTYQRYYQPVSYAVVKDAKAKVEQKPKPNWMLPAALIGAGVLFLAIRR